MFIFAYISLAVTVTIICFMPKRLTKREMYITWFIMSGLTIYINLLFGYIMDLYDFVDKEILLHDLFLQWALPSSFAILFLNFMPEKRGPFVWYLIGVTVISVLYELLSLHFAYLVYKG